MRTVTFNAEVYVQPVDELSPKIIATKACDLDVMRISVIRAWLTRNINKALREAPRDCLVWGSYIGRQTESPFNHYRGELGGVNGKIVRRTGEMEQ